MRVIGLDKGANFYKLLGKWMSLCRHCEKGKSKKPCSLDAKREWSGAVMTAKRLVHDSHFYVNVRPRVKWCGASLRRDNSL